MDSSVNWFTNRLVDQWKRLSSHAVSVDTIGTFKKRLDGSRIEALVDAVVWATHCAAWGRRDAGR